MGGGRYLPKDTLIFYDIWPLQNISGGRVYLAIDFSFHVNKIKFSKSSMKATPQISIFSGNKYVDYLIVIRYKVKEKWISHTKNIWIQFWFWTWIFARKFIGALVVVSLIVKRTNILGEIYYFCKANAK